MNVRFSEHLNYLEVIYTGERAYTKLIDLLSFIHRGCEKKNVSNIVIDLSQSKGEWADDGRDSLEMNISNIFPSVYRILVIDQKGRLPASSPKPGTDPCPQLGVVSNRQDGMDWLLKTEP